jgi:hypothetical protein
MFLGVNAFDAALNNSMLKGAGGLIFGLLNNSLIG